MGNQCCSYPNGMRSEVGNLPESYINEEKLQQQREESEMRQLTQMKSIKVGPEVFVSLKKGDIYSFYSLGKPLGEGAYGSVCQATHKRTGIVRAMKSMKKDALFEEDQNKLFAEMEILKNLDHPNIVKLYELYQDEKFYYLITEFLPGGELFDRIQETKNFSESKASKLMKQVLSAVAYCHEKNIVHRDLKPENIIFINKDQNSDLKVIDFGTSRSFKTDQKMKKRLGTPYYIAPEVLKREYNEKCDIWSCGDILHSMGRANKISSKIFLKGRSPFIVIYQIVNEFEAEEWQGISSEAKNLIEKMLESDPQKRLSAEQALQHPWFSKNETVTILNQKVLQNLSQFRVKGIFRQALLTFMASQMVSENEKEELKQTFRQLDKNGDGTLSKQEIFEGLTSMITEKEKIVPNLDERVQKIIDQLDANNSGKIDYTEFIAASLEQEKLLTKKKIEQTFQILDLDGDKQISKDELQEVMEGLNDEVIKKLYLMIFQIDLELVSS